MIIKNNDYKFEYSRTLKKDKIDIYIFVICDHIKENIEWIKQNLDIKEIPKKILNDHENERILYTNENEIMIYILPKNEKCDHKNIYKIYGKIGKKISQKNNKNIFIQLIGTNIMIKNEIISYILGLYEFNHFKTNQTSKNLKTYFWYSNKTNKTNKNNKSNKNINNIKNNKNDILKFIEIGTIQNELRSIINTPSNILTSTNYSIYIKNEIKKCKNINIKIYNEKELKKLGCNLILGVNQGSKNEAKMIVMNYKNIDTTKKDKPILLIGKGVMFDSGGYNLKTGDFSDMKYDMTGTAIIYGVLLLLSKFNIKGHFIGILPLVENMIGSNAIKPGDILTAYNGSTIEITNTDGEGRLILADAISYSCKYKPKLIIDIATLTGQCGAIFGNNTSVIMGNNNKYIQELIKYGMNNNEKIWELPMWEEYMEYTKSNIADYKNISYDINASTIMAGSFLYNFVPKNTDWIHIDIGGTSDISENTSTRYSGASGEIMRTLLDFLMNY